VATVQRQQRDEVEDEQREVERAQQAENGGDAVEDRRVGGRASPASRPTPTTDSGPFGSRGAR
jgi:hypothetical protein